MLITGLDGFRGDVPVICTDFFYNQGWAVIEAEIPGTGDCPADPRDAESPDRVWSTILDWIAAHPMLDAENVCAWGLSTGAYYSLRMAHTHADRVKGVVAQGAYSHYAFTPEWIECMYVHRKC